MKNFVIFISIIIVLFTGTLKSQENFIMLPTHTAKLPDGLLLQTSFSDTLSSFSVISASLVKNFYFFGDLKFVNILGQRPLKIKVPDIGIAYIPFSAFQQKARLDTRFSLQVSEFNYLDFLTTIGIQGTDWLLNLGFIQTFSNNEQTLETNHQLYFVNSGIQIKNTKFEFEAKLSPHEKAQWDVGISQEIFKDLFISAFVGNVSQSPNRRVALTYLFPVK